MKNILLIVLLSLCYMACQKEAALEEISVGKSGSITRFAVYQNYMYVLNLNEVQTYDVTQKDNPKLVHRLPTEYGLETITIYDSSAFVGSLTALYILNIDNPSAPSILSKSDRINDIGFSGCDPVAVKDNYAYSTIKVIENVCGQISAQSALIVYDVTDKSNPKVKGTYPLEMPNGLGYKDNLLFVCDEGSDELRVFDITDPKNLVEKSYDLVITDPYDLIIDGEKMIVSSKTNFYIYDISNLYDIKRIGQITK